MVLVAERLHPHDSTPSAGCSVRRATRPLVVAGDILHSNVNNKGFKYPEGWKE